MTTVYISDTKKGIKEAVEEIFKNLEKDGPILKSSKEVYIKVNGINFYKYAHTSPEVLEAVITYLKNKYEGVKIHVMENASQCAITRVVFAMTGYKEICEKLGAEIIYLDEEGSKTFEFKG